MQNRLVRNVKNPRVKQAFSAKNRTSLFLPKVRLWILYMLFMLWVIRNTILIRRRPGELYDAVDTMAIFQIGIIAVTILVLLNCPLSKFWQRIKKSSIKFYFFYYILAAVSALWSINPQFSLYRAIEVLTLSMSVLFFCLSTSGVEESIKRIYIIMWSTLLITALGIVLKSGFTWDLRNNGLGAISTMTACFFVAWLLSGKKTKNRNRFIQAAIGIIFILLSMSLASWWSFWFGISYTALLTKRKSLIAVLFLVGAGLFFSLGTDSRNNLLTRDKEYETIMQFHGRIHLWDSYMAASKEKPLLGYGFAVGAREIGHLYNTNTHNSFFAALIGLGWVGIGIWTGFFISLIRELIRYRHSLHPAWLGCAAALAAGGLNSMSISIFGEQWNPSTTVFVALLGLHMSFLQSARQTNLFSRYKNETPRNPLSSGKVQSIRFKKNIRSYGQ